MNDGNTINERVERIARESRDGGTLEEAGGGADGQEVAEALRKMNTHLEIEGGPMSSGYGPRYMTARTRKNGDVGRERPGKRDLEEARQVAEKLADRFPEWGFLVTSLDEWTHLKGKRGEAPDKMFKNVHGAYGPKG